MAPDGRSGYQRWQTLRSNPEYRADWRAHRSAAVQLEPAPFPLRIQSEADLVAARWGLLAWEDPRVRNRSSPFWANVTMVRAHAADSGSGSAPGDTVVTTVKWFDPVKGLGFLTPTDGSPDVFCHMSAVSRAGWDTLPEGATVTCEVEQGSQGPQVWQLHSVDASTASTGRERGGGPPAGEHGLGYDKRQVPSGRRVVATVKWFVPAKGFGFLVPDDGSPDAFCHMTAVRDAGYDTLPQGARVTCEVTDGQRGPVVSSIFAVDASTAAADPAGSAGPGYDRRDRGRGRDGTGGAVEERHGVVKFYNAAKGYGFVVPEDGGRDVFLHGSVLNQAGLAALEPSQRVSVMVELGARSPKVIDIEPI